MKHVKKLLSAVLVLVLALTMVLPVAAEGATGSITINNPKTGHDYEVYQIFTGDLSEDGTTLSNIEWGSAYATKPETAADVAAETLSSATGTDAEKIKAFLASYAVTSKYESLTYANGVYSSTALPTGYYLVKDKDGSLENQDDAYTQYIVKVVGAVTMKPKSAQPEVDKEVYDNSDNGASEGWNTTADHGINEKFNFKLTASLPEDVDFDAYETYKVKFTDTMSKGVVFDEIKSVTIIPKAEGVAPVTLTASDYKCSATAGLTAAENADSAQWTLEIANIKRENIDFTKGVDVEVVYEAHLNERATVNNASGSTDNKNTVGLEYSNNPNAEGTGKTPEKDVWVFTYKIDQQKIDGENEKPLEGAEFKLYTAVADGNGYKAGKEIALKYDETLQAYVLDTANTTGTGVAMKAEGEECKFNIVGLDAGRYFLKETKTPDGYNTCADIEVYINANHSVGDDGPNVDLTGSTQMSGGKIENNKGTTLPSTGGIGTTIFYVVGGILVVGAAVLLIAKKRTRM